MLYHPNLDFNTVKMFIDEFINCLSKNEYQRYKLQVQMINIFTNKQISLDKFLLNDNIKNYNKELREIKNGN